MQRPWSEMTLEELFVALETQKDGLETLVATKRRDLVGENAFPEERQRGALHVLIRQFENPLVLVLVGAAAITFFLRDYTDTIVIGAAIIINVSIGLFQEYKAERALAALKAYMEPTAIVFREGREHTILARHIVPGDMLILRAGAKVPADARLIEAIELEVNESTLTGETYPVAKTDTLLRSLAQGKRPVADLKNTIFAGTVVTQGLGRALVIATGAHTEFGRIAALLHTLPDERTPLQEKLRCLSSVLAAGILFITAAVFVFGIVHGRSIVEMFTMSVALAVSAIPEGLVVAVTAILAVGMQRILKRGALVRRLVAAETLGSTTVICTDKTGTLTEGRMRLARIVTDTRETRIDHTHVADRTVQKALEIAALGNTTVVEKTADDPDAWELVGAPTEVALVRGAAHGGIYRSTLLVERPLIDIVPFTSTRKYVMTLHKQKTTTTLYAVGAAERIVALATAVLTDRGTKPWSAKFREAWMEKIQRYARDGYRVLGLAYREGDGLLACAKIPGCEGSLTFVGLAIIEDPIREDVADVLLESRRAGVTTVMITGDHAATAGYVARTLGIQHDNNEALDGAYVDELGDDALRDRVATTTVYSRVSPEQKLRIVQAWQARGAVVAVTGDGVNDAPALKRADIGVAVGSGTDVAKEASDLVLMNNSFATLIHAIREGRVMYDNIRKVALYLLSDSFSEIVLVVGALFWGMPLPLLAAQILWINLITDGFPSVALTIDPATRDVMATPPIARERSIMDTKRLAIVLLVSVVTGIGNLLLFQWWYEVTGDLVRARTIVFASLSLDSLLYVFSIRTLRTTIWRVAPWNNLWLVAAVCGGFLLTVIGVALPALQHILGTTALTIEEWGIVAVFGIGIVVMIEGCKIIVRLFNREHKTLNSKS
ncbi:HAD-IC family P-type ATPase [Candidatus Uhrbacteria bacterium]|nr:HAD-IC family P-type ATPase [Candidatus Uhrbacteria bacterium]